MKRLDRKDWAKEHIKGLFHGCPTPFTADSAHLDEEALRFNLAHCVALGATGLGSGSTIGEAPCLTIDERKKINEILAEEGAKAGVVSYAYPVNDSIPITIELSQHAEKVGCDLLLVHVPYEWTKTDDMIFEFFKYLDDQINDISVMVYDTGHAGYLLPLDLQDRIADLPSVVAVKRAPASEVGLDQAGSVLGDRVVLTASSKEWREGAGAEGFMMNPGTAPYLLQTLEYQPIREMYDALLKGDSATAKKIFTTIEPLADTWGHLYRSLRMPVGKEVHPIAGIKFWMDVIGLRGGPVRPLTPASERDDEVWLIGELEKHIESGALKLSQGLNIPSGTKSYA